MWDAPHAELALALVLAFLIQMTTRDGAIAWLRLYLEQQVFRPRGAPDRARILGTVRSANGAAGLLLTFEPRLDDLRSLVMMRVFRELVGIPRWSGEAAPLAVTVPIGDGDRATVASQLLDRLRASATMVDGRRTIDGFGALRAAMDALEQAAS